jgi:hypothetical protein
MKKLLLIGSMLVLSTSCTWYQDYKKDWESDTKGLNRTAYIYSKDGKLLKTYESRNMRYDIYDTTVTLLVNNRRVLINNAIVIVEEK